MKIELIFYIHLANVALLEQVLFLCQTVLEKMIGNLENKTALTITRNNKVKNNSTHDKN